MDTPGDRSPQADLLAATCELVAVNRQIAETLANLEGLYAEEVRRNAEQRQKLDAQMARIGSPPSVSSWTIWVFFLPAMLLIALAVVLPDLIRGLNR